MFFVVLGKNLVALLSLNKESELLPISQGFNCLIVCMTLAVAENPFDEMLTTTSMYYSPVWLASKRGELGISVLTTESLMQLQLHANALPQIVAPLQRAKWNYVLSSRVVTGSSKLILVIVKRPHSLSHQGASICSKSLVLVSVMACHYLIWQPRWPRVIFSEEGVLSSRII